MYSASKIRLSEQIIQEVVSHHFGNQTTIISFDELVDGLFNTAYQIELADGLKCVLKVAPPDSVKVMRYEKDIMKAEVEVLNLVRERTEMPVPEIYCYDRSHRLILSDYFIMGFIPGVPLDKLRKHLSAEDQRRIDREAGRLLHQMNEIVGKDFGWCSQDDLRFGTWAEAFECMMSGLLQDGREMAVDLPLPYEELGKLTQDYCSALDEVVTPSLVHWDLWDGNIFIDPETKRMTGVIDFERALWGDPLMEVNFSGVIDPGAFIEGYGENMLSTPGQKYRRILYNIYLFLIMVIECYFRHYETQDQETWARRQVVLEMNKLRG